MPVDKMTNSKMDEMANCDRFKCVIKKWYIMTNSKLFSQSVQVIEISNDPNAKLSWRFVKCDDCQFDKRWK